MLTRKVLYVDDDEDHIKLVKEEIDKIVKKKIKETKIATTLYDIIGETDGGEAIKIIKKDQDMNIKAMILDKLLYVPGTKKKRGTKYQGEDVYDEVKKIIPLMPIIVLSKWEGSDKPTEGCFRKEKLFKSAEQFEKLEHTLEESILKREANEYSEFYPPDSGNLMWKRKWGPEYVQFRKSPDFPQKEADIGKSAEKDYLLIYNGKLMMSYRDYRGPNNIWNVLINRRVIFAVVNFCCLKGVRDSIKKIALETKGEDDNKKIVPNSVYQEVGGKLGFPDPDNDIQNVKDFMFKCGILQSGILNSSTMLKEEVVWQETLKDRITNKTSIKE